ncbi:MAG: FAD-binding oxidoreductase [Acidobacteriaceae bacterium]|nr:FAD-binding oxidoreductase [Acidobacteriaceae bacterium]
MLIKISRNHEFKRDGGTYPREMTPTEIGLPVDAAALETELKSQVRGEVRFDPGSRALYSTDASNYRQIPIGVVIPRDKEDVVRAVAACSRYRVPVLNRGGGTSLAGQCCNVAVVIDMSKYMRHVLQVDPDKKLGRVEPGCVLDDFRRATEKYSLIFGPDPATHNHCTLGGMVGNNSCGMHAQMAGKTTENVESLEVLTYDGLRMWVGRTSDDDLERFIREGGRKGEIYRKLKSLRDRYADQIRARFPKIPRLVSGYPLNELLPENGFNVARALVGTESTCVTVLEIVGNLVADPPVRNLLVLGYPDVYQAGDHIPEVLRYNPIACEGFNDRLLEDYKRKGLHLNEIKLMPQGKGWLILEFGGETKQEVDDRAHSLMEHLKNQKNAPTMQLYDDKPREHQIWEIRESALGGSSFVPGKEPAWAGWEDSAVPPDRVGSYLRDLDALFGKYGWQPSIFGHFGQGCLHIRVPFELTTQTGLDRFRSFMDEATTLVVKYGGSFSGEHGDGQARAQFLPKLFGDEIVEAFREFKAIWDPDGKMNPGKAIDAYSITENLKLGTNYDPPQPKTHFHYEADRFSFSNATLRCVGVGKCRREENGTMCPSYMVTHEEMHSTRGRARLLFEMLQGNPLSDGWRDEHVKEALDLCLSCKGCKGECPVNVDIATYKSEFLSHYYDGRLRPRSAYASGLIHRWARVASWMPATANFFTQTSGLSNLAKLAAGYSQKRQIPPFAPRTFKQWFAARVRHNEHKPKVILWADTFNNHFTPSVARAAVEVLEDAGYQVCVPRESLCCGRPLYDYGMLDLAEKLLREILTSLRPAIQQGIPVIGLEPSCVTVFRDEMTNLIHGNEDAKRLQQQTFLLSEFLEQKAGDYQIPQLKRQAVVHGHCHHKSTLQFGAEENVLRKTGLDYQILDSGCCGMAGAFGYERDHYEVGIKCGERVLLPAIRTASKGTLIIADGFSCREQIRQQTDRHALHLAQVLQMALHEGPRGPMSELPEEHYTDSERTPSMPVGILAGAIALGTAGMWIVRTRQKSK